MEHSWKEDLESVGTLVKMNIECSKRYNSKAIFYVHIYDVLKVIKHIIRFLLLICQLV